MVEVKVYSKKTCPHCVGAKKLLQEKGIEYKEIDAEQPGVFANIYQQTKHKTVPQIFINNEFVGGYSELQKLEETGTLNEKLGIQTTTLKWD